MIKENTDLVERCAELLEWNATSLLAGGSGGVVRALAEKLREKVGEHYALAMAENQTKDEAMRAVIQLSADLERARKALEEMVNTFEPFSLRPIGSPNSAIRKGQEHQIDVHKRARAALIEIAH